VTKKLVLRVYVLKFVLHTSHTPSGSTNHTTVTGGWSNPRSKLHGRHM